MSEDILGYSSHDWRKNTDDAIVVSSNIGIQLEVNKSKVIFTNPKTLKTEEVTFFSRSKQRLWTKGETSGNKLILESVEFDCDKDTLLVKAEQLGPTCHLENYSCFKTVFILKDDHF